jgi:arylsulfatase
MAVMTLAACDRAPAVQGKPAASPATASRPNVVWLLLDACRADHLSCYGYPRPTSPRIDALAARGTLFERNFSQGPNTPQSVHIFMTGRYSAVSYTYPGASGIWFQKNPPPEEQLISNIFRENGYATAMFSASPWYIAESRLAQSFEHYEPLISGPDAGGNTYRERNARLFDWIEQPHEKPFFLFVHMLDTHGPRYRNNTKTTWLDPGFPAQRDNELRSWEEDTFSPADQAHLTNLYDGGVAYADMAVDEILTALDRAGLSENTLVILGSDHGEFLGEDGHSISHPPADSHDDLLHVPLIMAGPGIPAGQRVGVVTQNADIVPTLVDRLKLNTSAAFHGASLTPIFNGSNEPLHQYAYARTLGWVLTSEPGRVLIFENAKFDFSPFAEGTVRPNYVPQRPQELVYAMPDRVGQRQTITPDPEQAEQARALLRDFFGPLWVAEKGLPEEVPPLFRVTLRPPSNKDAVANTLNATDNRWTPVPTRFASKTYSDNLYVASAGTETPPDIDFLSKVPNGEYHVTAYCAVVSTSPGRRVSFSYTFNHKNDADKIARLGPNVAENWVDLGTVTVTDGWFRLRVGVGHPGDDAVIGHLLFRTAAGTASAPDEIERRREELEALGYVQ